MIIKGLDISVPGSFVPHGMGYLNDDGEEILFVINHGGEHGTHYVNIFKVNAKEKELILVETLTDPNFISPNEIVPLTSTSFYLCNDQLLENGALKTLFGSFLSGNVVYYDWTDSKRTVSRVVATGIRYAAGMQAQGNTLYVSDALSKNLYIYEMTAYYGKGSLDLIKTVDLGTGLDNINIDEKGRLIIGGHPNIGLFIQSLVGDARAPSQIIQYDPLSGTSEEIFLSHGEDISASSVGVIYKNKLLVGTVSDNLLLCELK
eukprot:TRINITY_DN12114_c0_g1_i1.p1 TRINITY_DN12114_c0_g1~~TRINITY_DN12114_c0_g1_i1.p1  ORF type:complete len:261 (+),score=50.75 TRINITY_DN12114_c0_g1_i1:314-1096(+)